MRISTTALVKSAIILVAVLALVPQVAFAQLPVETRELKLQGAASGSLILKASSEGSAYTLSYPGAIGGAGSFLYIANSGTGALAYTNTPSATLTVPRWNNTAGEIQWVDPNGSDNPNWSISGNDFGAATSKTLGTKSGTDINVITNNVVRMVVASNGDIDINTGANAGDITNIGKTAKTVNIKGETNVNTTTTDATNIGTGAASGATTIGRSDGTTTIAGTTKLNENVNNNTSINTGNSTGTVAIGNAASTTNVLGVTNINTTGSQATNIGTGSSSGATALGRSDGTTTVVGTTTINNNVDNTTSINGGTSTGAVTIGGSAAQTISIGTGGDNKTVSIGSSTSTSTTTILSGSGNASINATGTAAVVIGNTTGGSTFTGEIRMVSDAGDNGEVLVSKGTGATPQWQNLSTATGIRAAGKLTVNDGSLTATVSTGLAALTANDAIIVTLEGIATSVTATVSNRTAGTSFEVTFSAAVTGTSSNSCRLNYMVIGSPTP